MAVHFYHLNAFDDWDTEYVQSMFNLHTQEKQSYIQNAQSNIQMKTVSCVT